MKYLPIIALALLLSVCSTEKTVKEQPFTVNFESPRIQAGSAEAQFEKLVNIAGLRTVKIKVDYFPLEDAVCLQYRLDLMTFYLYLDRDAREAFIKALEQYKEDYTNRALATKGSKKTRRTYGMIDVYIVWQAFSYTVRSRANTVADLGYDIKTVSNSRASFFTLYRREAIFRDKNLSEQDQKVAPNEIMLFTKAQADELAALFDQDFLKGLSLEGIRKNSGPLIPDAY